MLSFDVTIWCYYFFNGIILCYHFSQFANVIIFVLSFFLVQHGCFHLCYHLMFSFFVLISPLFSFSWKRDTLVRPCTLVCSWCDACLVDKYCIKSAKFPYFLCLLLDEVLKLCKHKSLHFLSLETLKKRGWGKPYMYKLYIGTYKHIHYTHHCSWIKNIN